MATEKQGMTTADFAAGLFDLKLEGSIKSALQRVTLRRLAVCAPDAKTAAVYELLAGKYSNAWEISTASRRDLLAVPGIGPAKLALIAEHLKSRNVRLAWEA